MAKDTQAANQAAKKLMAMVLLALDNVPNKDQAMEFFADGSALFTQVAATLDADKSTQMKAKFLIELGISLSRMGLDMAIPDEA